MSGALMLSPGAVFAGRFRVVRLLSYGGMGAIYEVTQEQTGATRALKVLLPQLAREEKFIRRFEREARIGSSIESDHVVQVIDAGVDRKTQTPWMAMELLRGETLSDYIGRKGRLSMVETAEVFSQLCHAVEAAHGQGVIHCDLKPENVFLAKPRRDGVPFTLKVLDFGIARMMAEAHATSTMMLGSPMWVAPEQTESEQKIEPETDVWALGLLAFYCLTGRPFWMRANEGSSSLPALMREILFDPIPPASERAEKIGVGDVLPPKFDIWFSRCVARDRVDRYGSVSALRQGLLTMLLPNIRSGEVSREVTLGVEPPREDRLSSKGTPPAEMGPPGASTTGVGRTDEFVDEVPRRRAGRWGWVGAATLAVGMVVAAGLMREDVPAVGIGGMVQAASASASAVEVAAAATVVAASSEAVPVGPLPGLAQSTGVTKRAELGAGGAGSRVDRATQEGARGYLALVCQPYCDEVIVRGQNLGPSPVLKVPLPPGTHSATLKRSGRVVKMVTFTIRSGESTSVRVSLDDKGASGCTPPYTVDASGKRRPKPECQPL